MPNQIPHRAESLALLSREAGFTLVEVIIVSALILLISLTAFQTADLVNTREKEERMRTALLEMRSAMDRFHQDNSRFPNSIDELLTSSPIQGGFFLRNFPLNPILGEKRWEIASRTSIAGTNDKWEEITLPNQGMSDATPIVDIRCPPSGGTGLNGIDYKNW